MRSIAYILTVKMMNLSKLFFKRKYIIRLLLAIVGIYAAIRFSKECSVGISKGTSFCLGVLVPSLFIFMVAAAYTVKSGAADLIARPFASITTRLFRLPPEAMTPILLSMIGGYPVGARCVAMMHEDGRLSESEAVKTSYTTVAAGPGFILNYIGRALLNSPETGNILLCAQVLGVLLTGIIVGKTVKCDIHQGGNRIILQNDNLLVNAVRDASYATFSMCSMVLIFSSVIEIAATVVHHPVALDIISAFLEVTTGCNLMCGAYPVYLVAFFVGFGGLSVHFQIFASLKDIAVNKSLFFLFRIIEGIITLSATYILLMIFPMKTAVFSSVYAPVSPASSATLVGSAALVISAMFFLGSIRKPNLRR